MVRQGRALGIARAACATGVSLAALLAGAPAGAELIPVASLMHGVAMTQQQCAQQPSTIWVNTTVGGFCMRYYLSTVGGDGRWAAVHLSGDKLGRADFKAGTFTPEAKPGTPAPKEDDTIDTAMLQRRADVLSKATGGPAVYLARIGIDGSSGHHLARHSVLELQVTNAALDGIKQLHKYEGFHLVGQSGGATLVGGLVGLRADIGCAIVGSGMLAQPPVNPQKANVDPGRLRFNPVESAGAIVRNRARVVVITDPEDKVVPANAQVGFTQRLRSAGGEAEQFFVQAPGESRHNTIPYSNAAAAGCARGETAQAIAKRIEQVQTRIAQAEAEKRAAATAAASQAPAAPAAVPAQASALPQPTQAARPASTQGASPGNRS